MIGTDEIGRVQGANAYDTGGEKIGTIDQVYLDDRTGEPSWVTVNTGLFGTATSFVPLQGAALEGDGVRLGYDKDRVTNAPRLDVDEHLAPDQEDQLYRHYGLADAPSDSHPDSGSEESVLLSEERLEVGTETREATRVRLRKYVTTEMKTVTVPVKKEKLVVEQVPVEIRPDADHPR